MRNTAVTLRAVSVLLVLAGLAIAPRPAVADITYTVNDDQGEGVTGYFVATTAAQANGQISFADVVALSFTIPTVVPGTTLTFSLTDLQPSWGSFATFPLPISMVDATPTASSYTLLGMGDYFGGTPRASVEFDSNFAVLSGQQLNADINATTHGQTDYGHWTVAGAVTVPEPSTLAIAGLAGVCGLAYGLARKRRA